MQTSTSVCVDSFLSERKMQKVKYTLKGGVGHVDISLHLLHVIINSIQALCALSHLQISHQKVQFHINVYCLKMNLMRELQCQR